MVLPCVPGDLFRSEKLNISSQLLHPSIWHLQRRRLICSSLTKLASCAARVLGLLTPHIYVPYPIAC